jgi:DNA-binding transcriptional regulator YiaG
MEKDPMMPIESLDRSLKERFPDAQVSIDRPRKSSGVWFLDITHADHSVIVQWQEGKEFGITSSTERTYGERADEVYKDEEAAYGRIVSLLLSRTFTSPPQAVSLKELRRESGLSQAELAEVLNRQQGEISKIERRKDVLVSTLADYVRAVHGDLQIIVRLQDGRIRRVQLEDTLEKSPLPAVALRRSGERR